MNASPLDPMRRYLLGQLEEEELDRLERRLLAEDEAFAGLDAAQDDLIEDYLDGTLGAADRAAFEAHFLAAPAHAESLACARLVREGLLRETAEVARPAAARPGRLQPGAVALWLGAAAAAVLVAIWLGRAPSDGPSIAGSSPPSGSAVPGPAEPASPRPGVSQPPATAAPLPVRTASATFIVNRAMSAGSEATTLQLDPGVEEARLEILLEGAAAYRDLSARLVPPDGAPIEWKRVAPREIVRLPLSVRRLAPGVYTLVLTGRPREGGEAVELDRWDLAVRRP